MAYPLVVTPICGGLHCRRRAHELQAAYACMVGMETGHGIHHTPASSDSAEGVRNTSATRVTLVETMHEHVRFNHRTAGTIGNQGSWDSSSSPHKQVLAPVPNPLFFADMVANSSRWVALSTPSIRLAIAASSVAADLSWRRPSL